MRTILDLTREDVEKILLEANRRCYTEIADEVGVHVNTVKKVVRMHNHGRLEQYFFIIPEEVTR